jgi:hypothetical protein
MTMMETKKQSGRPKTQFHAPEYTVVAMSEIPEQQKSRRSMAGDLYGKVKDLGEESALKVEFYNKLQADNVTRSMKELGKKDHLLISSSKTPDGTTRWYWQGEK